MISSQQLTKIGLCETNRMVFFDLSCCKCLTSCKQLSWSRDASGSSRIRKSESFRNDLNKQIFRASPPDNELEAMKSEGFNVLAFRRWIILSALIFEGKLPSGKKRRLSCRWQEQSCFLGLHKKFSPGANEYQYRGYQYRWKKSCREGNVIVQAK